MTSVASAVQQNCNSRSLIPGDLGATPTSRAFLYEGKVETDEGASAFVPVAPLQASATSGDVGRWEPPGGAPRFPPALWTPLGLQHPKRRARPPPGQLTDSADTQATKPKMSRIQARRIFPEVWLLPAVACNQGETKPLAQHPAQPAQKDPEQSSRGDCGWGLETPARGSGALANPAPALGSSAAPGERGAFSLVGFCTPDAELLLRGGCSLELFVLCCCFTPPRTPSSCCSSASDFEE